jgi:purine nucleosidase
MPRKVIIDCDMGIDDAAALCMLLFDRRLDVLAVNAAEGCVTAEQANNNLQAIVSQLDPARYPRLGMASPTDKAPPVDTRYLYGEDGLGNANFEASLRQHAQSAEKLIIDLVRANPNQVTILCLGPATNLAKALQRDPNLAAQIDQVVMTGGSLDARGNVTPCAEFNFYFDPDSAKSILQSRITTTLVPLDVTREVSFGLDLLDELPSPDSRSGYFLKQILPHAFRAFRQHLGQEAIALHDAVGALALIEPELFQCESLPCDVETEGELTRGLLVTDRRTVSDWRPNVNVMTAVKADQAKQSILDLLMLSGNASKG